PEPVTARGVDHEADGTGGTSPLTACLPAAAKAIFQILSNFSIDRYSNFAIVQLGKGRLREVRDMPQIDVIFYKDADATSPVHEWPQELRRSEPKVFGKLFVRIQPLGEMGHELRRPEADLLRDGIYELRVRWKTVNYRILYFFHGRELAVLTRGITKESEVPD